MLKITIKDREIEYSVHYRNVKYIRYELREGKLKVVLPKRYDVDVEDCVRRKEDWIYNKLIEYDKVHNELKKQTENKTLINRTLTELRLIVDSYIDKYQDLLNVHVNRLQFRCMTTKWGSCSSLGNVTLSKDLRFLPEELIAYIVYHELTHLIILAHNNDFFKIIKQEFPFYELYDQQLKEYWYLIYNNT
ncbi:M48 family metallopeptidase [Methanosphaera sp. WGK6]|uniref:M48 family metallopeptidase n=1 Tax=Methanosphaera sp. WGK6 TaxID=1561964 RepID=UPI00084BE5B1|nr:M48 family metallopeptidase [Methanosphaera sp. WGK6]OED30629.1 hypothetical protein NL43_01430 [Methanosphaera sp. WGK6]